MGRCARLDADRWLVPWRRKRATPRDDLTLPWNVWEDPAPDYLCEASQIVGMFGLDAREQPDDANAHALRQMQAWIMAPATDDERAMRGNAFLSAYALTAPTMAARAETIRSFLALERVVTEAEWTEVARRYREGE